MTKNEGKEPSYIIEHEQYGCIHMAFHSLQILKLKNVTLKYEQSFLMEIWLL